jgi:hypothetical protein
MIIGGRGSEIGEGAKPPLTILSPSLFKERGKEGGEVKVRLINSLYQTRGRGMGVVDTRILLG